MDETPVYFDMFTCVLTVLAYGTKLPPIVIFKGKQISKNLPSRIIVLIHPKGWMNESGMKTWFNKV
ncbi:2973_t:CDS:2 [Funneliformis caledonium]|uniref:2973_t:CDS:1 n=1 Tax=Funneliformis caledonium TaxID=1117310 RepID=A0A9N8Z0D1_9GLOM|nr:2973_t:CDS:2 [Funneliformis caledonium]